MKIISTIFFVLSIFLFSDAVKADEKACKDKLISTLTGQRWVLKTYFKKSESWPMGFERFEGGVQTNGYGGRKAVKIKGCDEIVIYWKPADKKEYRLEQNGSNFVGSRFKHGKRDYRAKMTSSKVLKTEETDSTLDDWLVSNKQLCSKDVDYFSKGVSDHISKLKSGNKIKKNFTISNFKMRRMYNENCS